MRIISVSSESSSQSSKPKSRCFWVFAGILALLATPVWVGIIYLSRSLIVSKHGWQAKNSGELISYEEANSGFFRSNISNYGWKFYCPPGDENCDQKQVLPKKYGLFAWGKESCLPKWTPYLIFALSGTWIWFATSFLAYARACDLEGGSHVVPASMLRMCFLAGLCFQMMAVLPANMLMVKSWQWIGCLHLIFAGLGFVLVWIHHAIHLKTVWGIIRIEIKVFFIACLLVVPPCLVMWRLGFWRQVQVGGSMTAEKKLELENSETARDQNPLKLRVEDGDLQVWRPGSLYEWIAAMTLFFYFMPYALWFFQKVRGTAALTELRNSWMSRV